MQICNFKVPVSCAVLHIEYLRSKKRHTDVWQLNWLKWPSAFVHNHSRRRDTARLVVCTRKREMERRWVRERGSEWGILLAEPEQTATTPSPPPLRQRDMTPTSISSTPALAHTNTHATHLFRKQCDVSSSLGDFPSPALHEVKVCNVHVGLFLFVNVSWEWDVTKGEQMEDCCLVYCIYILITTHTHATWSMFEHCCIFLKIPLLTCETFNCCYC